MTADPLDPPDADESIYLIVVDHPDETQAEAIARLGITEADIAGRQVQLIDTGVYR